MQQWNHYIFVSDTDNSNLQRFHAFNLCSKFIIVSDQFVQIDPGCFLNAEFHEVVQRISPCLCPYVRSFKPQLLQHDQKGFDCGCQDVLEGYRISSAAGFLSRFSDRFYNQFLFDAYQTVFTLCVLEQSATANKDMPFRYQVSNNF